MTPAKGYTVAFVGPSRSIALGAAVSAVVRNLELSGQVFAGDHLAPKNLTSLSALFHIGCQIDDLLLDIIACPVSLSNLAVTLAQAHRVAWVIAGDNRDRAIDRAVRAALSHGVEHHAVVLDTASVEEDVLADEDLVQLMTAEATELFEATALEAFVSTKLDSLEDPAAAADLKALATLMTGPWAAAADHEPGDAPVILSIERCYSVKGPTGQPAKSAYGAVRGARLKVGQVLSLLGSPVEPEQLRVFQIELFGQRSSTAPSGVSAAALVQGVSKGAPKIGQVITDAPDGFDLTKLVTVDLEVEPGRSSLEMLEIGRPIELCAGPVQVTATLSALTPDEGDPAGGRATLHLSNEIVVSRGQPVLLGSGSAMTAWGRIHETAWR